MKVLAVAALCVVFFAATALARPEGSLYTSKWDDIDVEQILNNERLLNSYGDCLKSKKPCTKEGQALKDVLPDALQTGCEKCNDTQKDKAKIVIKNLATKHADLFLELEAIFDKEHIYRTKYSDRIKAENYELPPLKA